MADSFNESRTFSAGFQIGIAKDNSNSPSACAILSLTVGSNPAVSLTVTKLELAGMAHDLIAALQAITS